MKHICYLSIGSNLGDRALNLKTAILKLSSFASVLGTSSFYETEPWGYEDEHHYINAVLKIETNFSPINLLKNIKIIEKTMGRKKHNNDNTYQARLIDLDILFFDSEIIKLDNLIIPHPKLYHRNYVLRPLCDLTPSFRCPITNKKVSELLLECDDPSKISLYTH